jgi:hypothetical protein
MAGLAAHGVRTTGWSPGGAFGTTKFIWVDADETARDAPNTAGAFPPPKVLTPG